jgi:hypothetical protein
MNLGARRKWISKMMSLELHNLLTMVFEGNLRQLAGFATFRRN